MCTNVRNLSSSLLPDDLTNFLDSHDGGELEAQLNSQQMTG